MEVANWWIYKVVELVEVGSVTNGASPSCFSEKRHPSPLFALRRKAVAVIDLIRSKKIYDEEQRPASEAGRKAIIISFLFPITYYILHNTHKYGNKATQFSYNLLPTICYILNITNDIAPIKYDDSKEALRCAEEREGQWVNKSSTIREAIP